MLEMGVVFGGVWLWWYVVVCGGMWWYVMVCVVLLVASVLASMRRLLCGGDGLKKNEICNSKKMSCEGIYPHYG